jgi:hypothetical protein
MVVYILKVQYLAGGHTLYIFEKLWKKLAKIIVDLDGLLKMFHVLLVHVFLFAALSDVI